LADEGTASLDSEINDLSNDQSCEISVTETEDDFFDIKGGPVYVRVVKEGLTIMLHIKSRESYAAGSRGVTRILVLSGGSDGIQKRADEFLDAANTLSGFVNVTLCCVGFVWPE
jgi:hypothetical protein